MIPEKVLQEIKKSLDKIDKKDQSVFYLNFNSEIKGRLSEIDFKRKNNIKNIDF